MRRLPSGICAACAGNQHATGRPPAHFLHTLASLRHMRRMDPTKEEELKKQYRTAAPEERGGKIYIEHTPGADITDVEIRSNNVCYTWSGRAAIASSSQPSQLLLSLSPHLRPKPNATTSMQLRRSSVRQLGKSRRRRGGKIRASCCRASVHGLDIRAKPESRWTDAETKRKRKGSEFPIQTIQPVRLNGENESYR